MAETHTVIDELDKLRKKVKAEDVSDYISSHLYMFYDDPRKIQLEIPKKNGETNLTLLVDAFGVGVPWRVIKEPADAVTVSIKCSPKAMKIFVMQYAGYAGSGIRVV